MDLGHPVPVGILVFLILLALIYCCKYTTLQYNVQVLIQHTTTFVYEWHDTACVLFLSV